MEKYNKARKQQKSSTEGGKNGTKQKRSEVRTTPDGRLSENTVTGLLNKLNADKQEQKVGGTEKEKSQPEKGDNETKSITTSTTTTARRAKLARRSKKTDLRRVGAPPRPRGNPSPPQSKIQQPKSNTRGSQPAKGTVAKVASKLNMGSPVKGFRMGNPKTQPSRPSQQQPKAKQPPQPRGKNRSSQPKKGIVAKMGNLVAKDLGGKMPTGVRPPTQSTTSNEPPKLQPKNGSKIADLHSKLAGIIQMNPFAKRPTSTTTTTTKRGSDPYMSRFKGRRRKGPKGRRPPTRFNNAKLPSAMTRKKGQPNLSKTSKKK